MRITDDRYHHQRAQLDLALRMIRHQARTGTIRHCTGLSDDRIRKLYTTYCKPGEGNAHRLRGKTPQQSYFFVRNPVLQSEASTLALLFSVYGLIRYRMNAACEHRIATDRMLCGSRFCSAYEAYLALHPAGRITFERAWCLLTVLVCGDELHLARCVECEGLYVNDALALSDGRCPCCKLRSLR